MTMTASIVSGVDPSLTDEIDLALNRWSATDTTLYYNRIGDGAANDVRFKAYDLPGSVLAQTIVGNFHQQQCPSDFNCEDTVENPPPSSHQPERWWYVGIRLDPGIYSFAQRTAVLEHELGHAVGLAHQPSPTTSRDGICDTEPPYSPNPVSIRMTIALMGARICRSP